MLRWISGVWKLPGRQAAPKAAKMPRFAHDNISPWLASGEASHRIGMEASEVKALSVIRERGLRGHRSHSELAPWMTRSSCHTFRDRDCVCTCGREPESVQTTIKICSGSLLPRSVSHSAPSPPVPTNAYPAAQHLLAQESAGTKKDSGCHGRKEQTNERKSRGRAANDDNFLATFGISVAVAGHSSAPRPPPSANSGQKKATMPPTLGAGRVVGVKSPH
ncbi:hypothetical protein B0T24DRAFT_130461 [Lasiosphaeria ovina]|uniref:Uncharacterized protein n=1 Tax=Lasiosphaeria ovina TaxID=92902 RepID=A0AAE0MY13_9PEZI|nr:hypothetical protein B0T24DRAFT_130461 [Lasiosphaeria ovina]